MPKVVINTKSLLATLENDAEFLKTLATTFLAECPGMLAQLRTAVAARDSIQVMNASHALKGSVSFLRADSAVEAARILECMGKTGELAGIDESLCVLEREMAFVSLALEDIAMETS
jgi:HPt (histidine-containing phosphotransfer) domain-containing protein